MTIITAWFAVIFLKLITGLEFGYENYQQTNWRNKFSNCAGFYQSPIFINTSQVIPVGMPNIEFIRYRNIIDEHFELQNNGHSVALSVDKSNINSNIFTDVPYIFGALLEDTYEFEGLHFHWGARNNRGSEHIINDVRYPLEMHLVHRNRKYSSTSQALQHRDGVTVVAILFQLSEKKYKPLDAILKNFHLVQETNTKVTLNNTIKLISFIPADMETFYIYKGSLTTPPCSESVTWIIFPDPITISFDQMNQFRMLEDGRKTKMVDNYRHIQPVRNRNIYLRRPGRKTAKHLLRWLRHFRLMWYS